MADDDPQMQPMQGWELKETAERYALFCHLFSSLQYISMQLIRTYPNVSASGPALTFF